MLFGNISTSQIYLRKDFGKSIISQEIKYIVNIRKEFNLMELNIFGLVKGHLTENLTVLEE